MSHDHTSPQDTPVTDQTFAQKETETRKGHSHGHGAKLTLIVTWRGQPYTAECTQDVWDNAHKILAEKASVSTCQGRWGRGFDFGKFRATKSSKAVPNPKARWGYQFDAWTSDKPNRFVLACHLILTADLHDMDPECKHTSHGVAGHVCHDVKLVSSRDEYAAGAKVRMTKARKARQMRIPGPMPILSAPSQPAVEPEAEAVDDIAIPPVDTGIPTVEAPRLFSGTQVVDAEEVLRFLPSLHNLAKPSLISIVTATADILVMTDLKGDEAFRAFELRNRRIMGSNSQHKEPPSPDKHLTIPRLVALFQKHGIDGIAATDAIRLLGPWKPEAFNRDMPEFALWQAAFHDAFRANKLHEALRDVRLDLHQSTDEKGRIIVNDHGETIWIVAAVLK